MSTQLQLHLVQTTGQQVFTTSLIIAEGCDNKSHESTIKLIRRYQPQLEQFGLLDFKSDEILNKHGRQTEYAILNEDQATFLEGGTDADDPSGTVGVARGTRGSPASDIPRRF